MMNFGTEIEIVTSFFSLHKLEGGVMKGGGKLNLRQKYYVELTRTVLVPTAVATLVAVHQNKQFVFS